MKPRTIQCDAVPCEMIESENGNVDPHEIINSLRVEEITTIFKLGLLLSESSM